VDTTTTNVTNCDNHITKTRAFLNIEAGLRNALENGEIDRETAKSLFEYLELEFATGHSNPFGTFDVTVSFYSQDILTITVEADSEDEAIESVQENISLDEMSLSFSISHNYESGEFAGDVDEWRWRDLIIDNLEYSATPSAE
jgi:hypothetical protein